MRGWMRVKWKEEGREVAGRARKWERAPPHGKPRDGVVDLALDKEALSLGSFDNARQARLITRRRLALACACGLETDRCVLGDPTSAVQDRSRRVDLTLDRLHRLIGLRQGQPDVGRLHALAGANREDVHEGPA